MTLLTSYNQGKTGFFRYRKVAGAYLLTGDTGEFVRLTEKEFGSFTSGGLKTGTPAYSRLEAGGFLGRKEDTDELSLKWRRKNSFIFSGPTLHIIVLTRRCNHSCLYCQAGSSVAHSKKSDMTRQVASRVLDTIFSSPAQALTIEFQGGEPLLNWPVLSFIVEEAAARASQTGKTVSLNLVTNLTEMTSERLNFLLKHRVGLCTSLDGPEKIHNGGRIFSGGNSHAAVSRWFKEIKKNSSGPGSPVDALLTVTRASLPHWKGLVDEYVRFGLPAIFIRFLNPFGAAKRAWGKIGYSAAEYVDFYQKALNYIVEQNLSGKSRIVENSARIFLAKIFGAVDPNFLDLRSPCGAGIGQMAYDCDGRVFTCDEGRMLAAMGDDAFCIGAAGPGSYADLISSPVVKATVTASLTDIQVSCSSCAYKPYCGVCPVYNYGEHGDLFMHQPSYRCEIHTGMLDHIFTLLKKKKVEALFRSWAATKTG